MTSYDAGDIVLVRYPFTDGTASKKRPAIILSPQVYTDQLDDVVLIPLTSVPDSNSSLALSQWRAAGLLKRSWVKPIIGTLTKRLILKHLGKLADADEKCIRTALAILLHDRWTNS